MYCLNSKIANRIEIVNQGLCHQCQKNTVLIGIALARLLSGRPKVVDPIESVEGFFPNITIVAW